jgi:hypothetical protein
LATPTCTGGTIQKTTAKGASFITAANISLSLMNFIDAGTSDGADPTNSTGTCGDLVTGSNSGCNAAIHLETVTTVLLDHLVLNGGAQQGINGYNVTGLTLSNSLVRNFGDNTREDGLRIKNLLGTSNITSTVFDGNEAHQARIENNSGTLNLTVSGNTFSNSAAPNGVDGLMIASHGSANVTVNAQNNTYTALRSDGFFASADGSSSMNVTVQGSTFNTASPATTIGAAAVDIVKGGTASLTFDIRNNTLRNNGSHVINLLKQSTATGGTFSGKITGNTIGTNGQETSGTTAGSGIRLLALGTGTLAATVDSNNVYGVTDRGIEANLQEESSGSNALEVKISNNNISTHYYDVPSGVYSMEGIYVNAGVTSLPANDAGTVCADISGNTVSTNNSASSLYYSIRLRQRFATTMRLPGYPGANNDTTAVASFISGKNTVNYGVSAQVNTPTGGGFTGGAACSTPALP